MTVNRQWFDSVQSVLYSKVTIKSLDDSDQIFNNLINSKHNIGKWVKHITMDCNILDKKTAIDFSLNLQTELLSAF